MCSTPIATFPDNNGLSNNLHYNLFFLGCSSSPGWLLVTRTRGAWWCHYRGHWRSGPRHLSPRSRVCAQEWHRKDIYSHAHSHPPMHTPKLNKEQNPQLTKHDACLYLSSSSSTWWWATARSFADGPQDCSTIEAFSPRIVLTENICRCVQRLLQHFQTTMAFLTTSTITYPCLAAAALQADSWWLGHVEPDVIMADIGGQALDIFLHGPESARKNGIVKTFTHTFIPIYPCTLLKQGKRKTLNSLNMTPAFTCPLPLQRGGGRRPAALRMVLRTFQRLRPSHLGQYWQKTFVDVLSKYSNLP